MEVGVNKLDLFHFLEIPTHGRGEAGFSVLYTTEKEGKKQNSGPFLTGCQMPEILEEDFTYWFIEDL